MNIALWVVQGLLGAMFFMSGLMKAGQPKEKLAERLPWVNDFSTGTVKFIGVSQLLASIGLIVPQATGIAPVLTPLAAAGLGLTMALALVYHLRKGEYKSLYINGPILAMAIFVAVGRF